MCARTSCFLAAAILAQPLPAYADCAARIAAVEQNPAVSSRGAPSGESVHVDGGESRHQQGGPATPTESWFTGSENDDEKPSVLTHLTAARDAREAGDEQACLEAVGEAEEALRDK
jgi:hypothetical protein